MNKILSLAAVGLLLASCSESEKENIPVNADAKEVAIVVGSKVEGLATKADGTTVTARVLMRDGNAADWTGWTEKKENTLNASQAFENATDRANSSVASFIAGGKLSFNPDLYHDSKTTSTESFLAAVSPAGEVKDKTVLIATQDGLQDVMYVAPASVGTKVSHTGPYSLDFKHKTAQLKFAIKMTAASSNGAWVGKKTVALKSITVQNAGLPTSVDFTNGSLTYTTSNLSISGISSPAVSTTASSVGQPVMIQDGGVILNVDITVDGAVKSYNNVKVLNDSKAPLATVAGSAHTITLNVQEPTEAAASESALEVSATISDWTLGENGTADLK